jgi:hypothetical protein
MQEALSVHFQGLVFRERNAGKRIDEHMKDYGFNNQIGINPDTGFGELVAVLERFLDSTLVSSFRRQRRQLRHLDGQDGIVGEGED